MNPKNNTMVEKYTKLWEEGLYMAQSKVFKNDWVTINRGFISLESFLAANHAKIEVAIDCVSCGVDGLISYLYLQTEHNQDQ